jgi:hypothetical protein
MFPSRMLDADNIGWLITGLLVAVVLGIVAFTAAKWVGR